MIISVLSLFTSIIVFRTENDVYRFNIIDFVGNSSEFDDVVRQRYNGPVILDVTESTVVIFALVVIAAVFCALLGLLTLRAQRPNTWQFVFTIAGLIGVTIPSLVVIIIVLGYGKYYDGVISFGLAPLITPVTMIICIGTVVRRKNKVAEELRKEMERKGLIQQAGDL